MKSRGSLILSLACATALALPVQQAEAANVSVGVGIGFGGGYGRRGYCGPYRGWYRPYGYYPGFYGSYYNGPYCGPYAPYYYGGPPVVYYSGPPRAPYSNYDESDPSDWPKENPADRKDHGALLTARAWSALANGAFDDAADRFTDAIDDHPSLGIPRIGYSITAARLGDLPTGVRAMREALHYDPKSLNHVPRNELLDAKIGNVLDRYRSSYERSESQADPAFMIACLEYILGHKAKAAASLDKALKSGDDSVAAQNLRDLLDARPSKAKTYKAVDPDSGS